MRQTSVFWSVVSAAAFSAGCADTSACPPAHRLIDGACTPPAAPCPEEVKRAIPTGCILDPREVADRSGEPVSFFSWELTVEPRPIESGERFAAGFRGRVVVGEDTFNVGLTTLSAFRRVAITKVEARVQVRGGAEGSDVELGLAPHPSTCTYTDEGRTDPEDVEFPECDPENDLEGGGNTDCIGLGGGPNPMNPCLLYFPFETSNDCSNDGVCARLGQVGDGEGCDTACECVGFCATSEVVVPLEEAEGVFIAEASGSVLFGWAEPSIGVVQTGPNRGAFDLEQVRRKYGEPIRYSGIDARVLGIPLAFECITGEHSRRSDVATTEIGLSRSPDSTLISCPIQEPTSN